jgi:hypothetical protein
MQPSAAYTTSSTKPKGLGVQMAKIWGTCVGLNTHGRLAEDHLETVSKPFES